MRNSFAHHCNDQHFDEVMIYIYINQSNTEFTRLLKQEITRLLPKHERWLVLHKIWRNISCFLVKMCCGENEAYEE